ncbi:MAG: SAM-dependent methyltransferase [Euryarchaeota archaeon]|nr:SAM-dependent methyltransferase [Euryarchaeota archaeon]
MFPERDVEEIRHRLKRMSNAAASTNEPLSWFEELYSSARGDDNWIPWSDGSPSPFVVEWAIGKPPGRALVVGCGLGEDAVFLDKNGWDVVAFDLSPTAIEWAKKRHEKSSIEWVVADLLNPPDEWRSQFELVLEVHILQAIPENIRNNAARTLPIFVAEGGHLVCIGRFDEAGNPHEGPPWPLNQEFIESIGESLGRMSMVKATLPDDDPSTIRYRATWSSADY